MKLMDLTVTGPRMQPAGLQFGRGLTVVYGASDTGKTYVAQALDFMLGASALKPLPEGQGYDTAYLRIEFDDGGGVVLGRDLDGGRFSLWTELLNIPPGRPADDSLAAKHSSRSSKNLSRYLLGALGLEGVNLRKNADGVTRPLSFRDLAHLCIIDETSIQDPTPALHTQESIHRTVERSVFRVLIEGGEGDPLFSQKQSSSQRVDATRAGEINAIIRELETRESAQVTRSSAVDRLTRIETAIAELAFGFSGRSARRSNLVDRLSELDLRVSRIDEDIRDTATLLRRLRVLSERYASDLQRLEMVEEAGSLLGYFRFDTCPFCGAAVEDQQSDGSHLLAEFGELEASVNAERSKIEALRTGLEATLADLEARNQRARELRADVVRQHQTVAADLENLDAEIGRADDLQGLVEARLEVEEQLRTLDQIEELEARRQALLPPPSPEVDNASPDVAALGAFEAMMSQILVRWGLPGGESVSFDVSTGDVLVGGRPRSGRGKGVRAIIHAAFTMALAEYCIESRLPHPGFVVLDSPLVTFHDPIDEQPREGDPDPVDDAVAESFYRYASESFPGQVIVLENTDPPAGLSARLERFTGSSTVGRSGFYPPVVDTDRLFDANLR